MSARTIRYDYSGNHHIVTMQVDHDTTTAFKQEVLEEIKDRLGRKLVRILYAHKNPVVVEIEDWVRNYGHYDLVGMSVSLTDIDYRNITIPYYEWSGVETLPRTRLSLWTRVKLFLSRTWLVRFP